MAATVFPYVQSLSQEEPVDKSISAAAPISIRGRLFIKIVVDFLLES